MPNQPTSFRFPFSVPDDVHPSVRNALRITYNGVKDLNDAINALNSKVNTNTASIATVTQAAAATSSSGGGGGGSTVFGVVNLQPNLTPGAYTLAQSDLGGLILVQSGIAFALTLNSGLVTPFFTTVYNLGAGTVTATPSLGLVNNGGSVTLKTGKFGIFYFDANGNWWEVFPILAKTFANVPKNWLDSYDETTGVFHASQPEAADLRNGVTGGGKVVLESGPTLHATDGGTGILSILGLPAFLNNAAAVGGGLVVGNLYRTGLDPDQICVVH